MSANSAKHLNALPLTTVTDKVDGNPIKDASQSADALFRELAASWLMHSPVIGPDYLRVGANEDSHPPNSNPVA